MVARGQATIYIQKDGYTITQSLSEYVVPADSTGKVTAAVTVVSTVKVSLGDEPFTAFTFGTISKPTGFSSITADNSAKTVKYVIAAGTTTLTDQGVVDIPILISGITYHLSFAWSKAKAGVQGKAGVDANLLDWVGEWNTGKTLIGSSTVITPKLFAGAKNTDGTLTGIAIGNFALSTKTTGGTVTTETANGIYGFKDGYKTFFVDNGGNVQMGYGDQSVKYNALTGKIEFGSAVALAWAGSTYIDAAGIFTGTLSATTINAITLNASQITSGTISAGRIDVAALKSSLITATNINALALTVTKGTLGGWTIDSDSLYRGAKKNVSDTFTAASGAITIGSTGLRGYKWRLDSTGAGAVAGGNISWAATGDVTFAASVALAWTAPISTITAALGGAAFPKMTYIGASGIYTGSLTATQITAGTISSDRIAAGSITAVKLDAASIKADIINTSYINGLSCMFSKGIIGGWNIGADNISAGSIGAIGARPIQIRSAESGSGYWFSGAYKPYGISLTWYQSSNAGHIVFGQIAATGNTVKTGFVGIQMMSWDGLEYFCLSTNYTKSGSKEVYNRIAGWAFNNTVISKGNVSLGSDGSITNGVKWKLNNDGSGQVASGNITWNAAGAVTFGASVSVNWTAGITTAQELASAMAFGKMIYRDPTFWSGTNSVRLYNNAANGTVTLTRTTDVTAPNDSKYVLTLQTAGEASPRNGGFCFATPCSYRKVFISRIIARIPAGHKLCWATNSIGTDGNSKWLTSQEGTGDWAEYVHKVVCGTENFATTNFFYLDGVQGTVAEPVIWSIAYVSVFDTTSVEKYTTTLDSNGIYTGTLTAAQVNAVAINAGSITTGTLSADRIAAGSIAASKLNAASIKSDIINTAYINALSCTFDKGTIGGWAIGASALTASHMAIDNGNRRIVVYGTGANATSGNRVQLYYVSDSDFGLFAANSAGVCVAQLGAVNQIAGWSIEPTTIRKGNVSLGSDGSVTNGTKWKLNNDGSGQIASGNISWNAAGTVTFSTAVALAWTAGINAITTALGGVSYPKLTRISATGIYTGTIGAGQIQVDTALVVGGSSYNGSISVRDAGDNTKVTLDRTGITAVAGTIGGWALGTSALSAAAPSSGHRIVLSASGYMYNANPSSGVDYWALKADGAATFGCGKTSFANDGSGFVANMNLSWDANGNIIANNGTFNNVTINGTIRNAFILNDSTIYLGGEDPQLNLNRYDHVVAVRGSFTEDIPLPWTLEHSGRRVCLVNYKWRTNTTIGYMTITAPSGKYFYEDGIAKSSISFSREMIELLGYGDDISFFGWIVVNRIDLMTTGKYGSVCRYLAQGTVSVYSSSSLSVKYKTFDGSTVSVTRLNKGQYRIYMPSSWNISGKYTVFLSGNYSSIDNTSIYASLKTMYSYYFDVYTQDDSTQNDGSFNFMVVGTGDWK